MANKPNDTETTTTSKEQEVKIEAPTSVDGTYKGDALILDTEYGDHVLALEERVEGAALALSTAKAALAQAGYALDEAMDGSGCETIALKTSTGNFIRVSRNQSTSVNRKVLETLSDEDKARFTEEIEYHNLRPTVVAAAVGAETIGDLTEAVRGHGISRKKAGKRAYQVKDMERATEWLQSIGLDPSVAIKTVSAGVVPRKGADLDEAPAELIVRSPYTVTT